MSLLQIINKAQSGTLHREKDVLAMSSKQPNGLFEWNI